MNEEEYLRVLAEEPGHALFADYAKLLIEQARLTEALLVCLKGLSSAPGEHRGRLLLARVFYELGMLPFAAREVEQLCSELPERNSLRALLHRLAPGRSPAPAAARSGEGTIAEMDLVIDELDLAGKEEDE